MPVSIQYLGHSAFMLKSKESVVVTDPFESSIGFKMPKVAADFITISHGHPDHNALTLVGPTPRRDKPFIIDAPGEYEVAGVSVFGLPTFHDATDGTERGGNIIYSIHLDGVVVVHLGDLGHALSDATLAQLQKVDVLLCPVGGVYTIDPKTAVEVIQALEPSYIIPMHYKTDKHNQDTFGKLATLDEFTTAYGMHPEPVASLTVNPSTLPEETELVLLTPASS